MIQLDDLLRTTAARLHGTPYATHFSDFCYDSRLAAPGQLFLALRTERRDGHAFIADAVRAGCTGVLCECPPTEPLAATIIVVPDVRQALQQWAGALLRRYRPLVIGVTGSVGKTGTKRAIATVLAGLGPTFASRRSFNSLFGLPIALGRLEPHHRFAVLEMGLDRFGEMRRLVELFPPTIGVVTRIAPAHLRFLGDEERIAAEKGELIRALPPDGLALLNADDPRVAAMARSTRAPVLWLTTQPGHEHDPDWVCAGPAQVSAEGTSFTITHAGQHATAHLPLLGEHSRLTALAAVGVALRCGMALPEAVERLRLIERLAGRLNPLPGRNGALIIDDTYNASPAAMHAALDLLAALPAQRRIAILGDMVELGEASEQLHREVGAHAQAVADLLITKGDLAAWMAQPDPRPAAPARPRAQTIVTHTAADAIAAARAALAPGTLVLVKGSREARMEQVVAGLLAPEVQADAVLVRQEAAYATVRASEPGRPTWLEVDLQAIVDNLAALRRRIGPTVRLLVTLKADAYGHGAIRIARTALHHGAWGFGVATLGEALTLRRAGIDAPILILGYTPAWQVRDAIRHGVRLTVFDATVAREIGLAVEELRQPATVHVKVDTGMARLGLAVDEAAAFVRLLRDLPGITVEGIFTHFATADSADESFARLQLQRFTALLAELEAAGLRPPLAHAANSAAVLRFPEAHLDLVRPGIAVYGLSPSAETPLPPEFRPALSFKTEIAQVRCLPPGASVSYGRAFITQRASRIATIPVGYADGFRRSPSWHAVLVHGRRAPVVGRVAMDYAMIDVTDIPGVHPGDEVVLIGQQGDDRISAEEVADWLGTIAYEVVAAILPRVPRVV
ncbi:alanine racemase [Kallotenue papyrolyticum]|uniref:alanine racemase n=1 Tax=Kallotenue papyrolyticum TaxID=1325125 RepID=UPI0004785660|nr:alanine racemase [Kallotenue papyrolyticum]